MSKLSFRSRQVDYNKPLPIYLNHDLPDLQDFAAINRSVPQMPTGMEKDEEAEHHLQRALSAFQAFGANTSSAQDYAIPTPRVETDDKLYERIYENVESHVKQKQYIRIQPFANDYEYPDYDADWEDQQWVRDQQQQQQQSKDNSTTRLPVDFSDDLCLFFETIMDCLEKATGFSSQLMSRDEAAALLKKEAYTHTSEENEFLKRKLYSKQYEQEKESFLVSVYEYWRAKRQRLRHPLTPTVMTDKSGVVCAPNNPYLVFRRRTEKMQTRKNRKNEEHSYENMLILKRDLLRAQQILRVIKQREALKRDLMKLTLEQVEKRFRAGDFDASLVDSIKNSLRPPSLSHHNTNTSQAAAASAIAVNLLVSNPALLKQLGLQPHQLDAKTLAQLLQQNPRLKSFVSSVAANAAAVAANNNNKKPVDPTTTIGNNKKLVVNKKNLVNHSTSSSALTNHQRLSQQQQQQTNTSNKKSATVNVSSNNKMSAAGVPLPGSGLKSGMSTSNKMMTVDVVNSSNSNNKRRLMRPGSESSSTTTTSAALISGVVNPSLVAEHEENNEFVEAMRAHDITNLDSVLEDYKSCFESEGTYRFQRKEGCKYLPPSGSLFKSDPFELSGTLNRLSRTEYIANLNAAITATTATTTATPPPPPVNSFNNTNILVDDSNKINTGEISNNNSGGGDNRKETSQESGVRGGSGPIGCAASLLGSGYGAPPAHLKMTNAKRIRQLRELHYKYYGYVRDNRNKHLGLVRRRLGRNGRTILERFDPETVDLLRNPDEQQQNGGHVNHHSLVSAEQQIYSFDIYSKFKTYYPMECYEPHESESTHASNTRRLTLRLEAAAMNNNRANSGGYDDDEDNESDDDDDETKVPQQNGGVRYDHTLFPIYYPTYEESVANNSPMNEQDDSETAAMPSDPQVDSLFKELFSYNDNQSSFGAENSSSSSGEDEFRAGRNIIQLNLRSEARLNQEYHLDQERSRRRRRWPTTTTTNNNRFNTNHDEDEEMREDETDDEEEEDEETAAADISDNNNTRDDSSYGLSTSEIKLALRVFQLPNNNSNINNNKVSNSDIIDKNNNINSSSSSSEYSGNDTTTLERMTTTNTQSNGNGVEPASCQTSLSREPTTNKSTGVMALNPGVGLESTTTGGMQQQQHQLINSKPVNSRNIKSEPLSHAAITTFTTTLDSSSSSPIVKKQPNIIYSKSTISSLLQQTTNSSTPSSSSSVIQTAMFYSPPTNNNNNSSTSTSSLPSSSAVSSSSSLVNGMSSSSSPSVVTNGPVVVVSGSNGGTSGNGGGGLLPTANIINGILSKKHQQYEQQQSEDHKYQDNHVSSSATASTSTSQSTMNSSSHSSDGSINDKHAASLIVAAATTTSTSTSSLQ